ncbi:hypothetical protein [Aeromonas media]|uniref:hypothetical protein n=1 Tax=Aeromonas media TaxID=651 RepID=UPI000286247A|nr:hypothetical protein [Aeromonas media]AHX60274.1 chromosome segregation ATPase [Aeromonas media WS]
MNIYISGGPALTLDEYENNKINYVSYEEWLSLLKTEPQDSYFIWRYRFPWRDKVDDEELNLDGFESWHKIQQKILSSIKKDNRKVVLFNEDEISLPVILERTFNSAKNENKARIIQTEKNSIDNIFLSLMSVWGKQYWNTLERLENISLSLNGVKSIRRNNFSANPKETLASWLTFISITRKLKNENEVLNGKISLRFNELAKLTIMLEEQHKNHLSVTQKMNTLNAITESNKIELIKSSEQLQEKTNQLSEVQEKHKILHLEYEKVTSELAKKNTTLVNDLKRSNDKNLDLLTKIKEQNHNVASLEKEIVLQKTANVDANHKIVKLSSELDIYKKSVNQRFSELAAITSMLDLSERKIIQLQEQLASANEKNVAIRNSLSWKATAPIRALRNPVGMRKNKQEKKLQESIQLIQNSDLFDPQWYLAQNPDVRESGIDPARHYLIFGGFENRDPSSSFSSQYYLELYPDVKHSGMNPLEHYIKFGIDEKRIQSN